MPVKPSFKNMCERKLTKTCLYYVKAWVKSAFNTYIPKVGSEDGSRCCFARRLYSWVGREILQMINQTVSENLCNFTCPACHCIGFTFIKIFWRKCVPSKQGNNDVLKKALFPVCERWKTLQNKAVVVHTYTKTKDSHPALSVFYEQLPLAQRSNALTLQK